MVELFWLLLPVAAFSGWAAGRREGRGRASSGVALPSHYVRGLNYLLSEQQDKAIEVFTRMLEVDSDTAETHLALGNLFRRQGEVDRAIRIHQNLIARPTLSRDQRAYALLELGHDYMKAGLLDRAESLFEQVVQAGQYVEAALKQLLVIYQQEREWQRAIDVALKLEARGQEGRGLVAQFYCELAEQARQGRDLAQAKALLKQALGQDPQCVRASLLQGEIEQELGNPRAALKAYLRVSHQDAEYLPEALEPLSRCYQALGDPQGLVRYLEGVVAEHPSAAPALALVEQLRRERGERAAMDFLCAHLRRAPSVPGLARLASLSRECRGEGERRDLDVLVDLFADLLRRRPNYECRQCGFTAKSLYWQCPSCRSWATVKPITSLAGE